MMRPKIISADLLPAYLKEAPKGLQEKFEALREAEISTDTFIFMALPILQALCQNLSL